MPLKDVHVIVNPASSAGKTARRVPGILRRLEERLRREFSLFVTTRPLEATDSAKSAIERGCEHIVAVGGDGTIQEVVNGFAVDETSLYHACRLGVIGSGTAQDFTRSFGLPKAVDGQVEVACGDRQRPVDVGRVVYRGANGEFVHRFFVNECQQGIAAVVVQRVQRLQKRLGGFLGFGLTAVRTVASHREQPMTVTIDDEHTVSDSLLGVVVANGGFAGGGMNFAPHARVDDGLLDIVIIHRQKIPSRLFNFPKIYFGKHIDLPWISYFQGKRVSVSSTEDVRIEADGELLGFLPCSIEIIPRALQLKSGPVPAAQ